MGESTPDAPRRCQACQRPLESAGELGWECECGIAVCTSPDCMDECFKTVAGGEGIRCRACGLVT